MLKGQNTDLSIQNTLGYHPLTRALSNQQWRTASSLVEKGANVNLKDGFGYTPLQYAISQAHWDMVEFLIKKGADVNAWEGNQYGAQGQCIEISEYMQHSNCNLPHQSPLDIIVAQKNWEKAFYLIRHGAVITSRSLEALKSVFSREQLEFATHIVTLQKSRQTIRQLINNRYANAFTSAFTSGSHTQIISSIHSLIAFIDRDKNTVFETKEQLINTLENLDLFWKDKLIAALRPFISSENDIRRYVIRYRPSLTQSNNLGHFSPSLKNSSLEDRQVCASPRKF